MSPSHRWPPLERRILEALPAGSPGLDRAELNARLEVIAGNEWIVDEALADLLSAGVLRETELADGRNCFTVGAVPPKGV